MQRICTNFEHSIYAARVASNKELYGTLFIHILLIPIFNQFPSQFRYYSITTTQLLFIKVK
jgi:hypothetical protein